MLLKTSYNLISFCFRAFMFLEWFISKLLFIRNIKDHFSFSLLLQYVYVKLVLPLAAAFLSILFCWLRESNYTDPQETLLSMYCVCALDILRKAFTSNIHWQQLHILNIT